jgi:hypothetical protein
MGYLQENQAHPEAHRCVVQDHLPEQLRGVRRPDKINRTNQKGVISKKTSRMNKVKSPDLAGGG